MTQVRATQPEPDDDLPPLPSERSAPRLPDDEIPELDEVDAPEAPAEDIPQLPERPELVADEAPTDSSDDAVPRRAPQGHVAPQESA